jgi:hypothetical protein
MQVPISPQTLRTSFHNNEKEPLQKPKCIVHGYIPDYVEALSICKKLKGYEISKLTNLMKN